MKEHKRKGGRESLYKDNLIAIGEKLAGYGYTEKQIANVIGVTYSTLWRWMKKNPEFCDAIKRGTDKANEQVINALFMNACGGFRTSLKTRYRQGKVVEQYETFASPNVTAQIFWLKNKTGGQWRDKHEIENTGKGTTVNVYPEKVLVFKDMVKNANDRNTDRKTLGTPNLGEAGSLYAGEGPKGDSGSEAV